MRLEDPLSLSLDFSFELLYLLCVLAKVHLYDCHLLLCLFFGFFGCLLLGQRLLLLLEDARQLFGHVGLLILC